MSDISPLAATLASRCPRCAEKGLFVGMVGFAPACGTCGLEFLKFNVGDGPAAFLILIVGAVLTVAAIVVDLSYQPAYWVHLIWIPVGAALTILGLRTGKAFLLAQEYQHQAREGRLAD